MGEGEQVLKAESFLNYQVLGAQSFFRVSYEFLKV